MNYCVTDFCRTPVRLQICSLQFTLSSTAFFALFSGLAIVEDEKIEKLLRAAMAAPSAGNQQPWEFYVVTNSETLQRLAKTSPYAGCTATAPLAFVVCTKKECRMPEYAQIDVSAAIENLLLEADGLGLGAVWLGIAPLTERMDAVRDVLQLPEELDAFAIVPCGCPAQERVQ